MCSRPVLSHPNDIALNLEGWSLRRDPLRRFGLEVGMMVVIGRAENRLRHAKIVGSERYIGAVLHKPRCSGMAKDVRRYVGFEVALFVMPPKPGRLARRLERLADRADRLAFPLDNEIMRDHAA